MKVGLKKLVWVLGGLCSALLILLVLAMTSPVQTWVARKVLANQPELGSEIGQVRVGWHQLNLEQGKFELSGAVLTLPQLQADFPVVAAAWKHEVAITKLVARGWTLDLTRYTTKVTKTAANAAHRADFSLISTAHAAAVPVPSLSDAFAGVFAQLELPVDLSLDGAILEGEVIVPAGPGNKPVTLRVSLLGGGLQAGHNGVFNIDAQTDLTGMGGPVDRLKVGGTVSALMDSPRTFAKFFADLNSQAVGGAFPQGGAAECRTIGRQNQWRRRLCADPADCREATAGCAGQSAGERLPFWRGLAGGYARHGCGSVCLGPVFAHL